MHHNTLCIPQVFKFSTGVFFLLSYTLARLHSKLPNEWSSIEVEDDLLIITVIALHLLLFYTDVAQYSPCMCKWQITVILMQRHGDLQWYCIVGIQEKRLLRRNTISEELNFKAFVTMESVLRILNTSPVVTWCLISSIRIYIHWSR